MTTKRSVIQIDVDDGPFKRFAESFAKYRRALGEAKEQSKELSDATKAATSLEAKALEARKKAFETQSKDDKAAAKNAREAAAIANANVAALKKKSDEERKAATDRKKERDQEIGGLKESARWTAEIARNIASGALSASKWLAFGAIASGFGLGGLASSAATARRQAQGYGINTGDLRAANVNFGKYVDPASALSNIANTKDSNDRWIFGRVGVNTTGKSAADILPEYLEKVVQAFRATGNNTSAAESTGLTKIISADELRALASLKPAELADTIKSFQRDRNAFANDDETNRGWQEFLVSMQRAGQQIEVSLIKNLQTLTPYLTQFADSIAKAINSFVSNGGLQEWIKTVGEGLKRLGTYLGSKDFQDDVQTFFRAMHSMAVWLGKWFPAATPTAVGGASSQAAISTAEYGSDNKELESLLSTPQEKLRRVKEMSDKYKLPAGLLDSVWWKESRRGANPGLSSAGAGGDFQAMPGTAAQYGIKDRWNFAQSSEGMAHYLADLLAKYSGDKDKALAAYNWGPGNLDKDIREHKEKWLQYAPAETQKYVTGGLVKITVDNQTGGNAQISMAGLAGG